MKIDTLIFGGASTKVPVYVGILKALYEKNLINESLDGINHIITCSAGYLLGLYLLLNIPLHVQETILIEADFSSLIDLNSTNINSLLFDLGLFDNHLAPSFIRSILIAHYSQEDMTLKELYNINPILLTVKCVNATKGCNEYINVKTNPELSILTLFRMTTAIPLFIKPIEYEGNLYVDGGLTGGYPIELVKDNYLGFNIFGHPRETNSDKTKSNDTTDILNSIPIISFILSLLKINVINYKDTCKIKTIEYETDLHFTEFNVPKDKKIELIKLGYDKTIQHIQQYNLTNDNFTESSKPDEDISPTEED